MHCIYSTVAFTFWKLTNCTKHRPQCINRGKNEFTSLALYLALFQVWIILACTCTCCTRLTLDCHLYASVEINAPWCNTNVNRFYVVKHVTWRCVCNLINKLACLQLHPCTPLIRILKPSRVAFYQKVCPVEWNVRHLNVKSEFLIWDTYNDNKKKRFRKDLSGSLTSLWVLMDWVISDLSSSRCCF